MADIHYITVNGPEWQWGEDYIYAFATYLVACPPKRTCQVGMGVMAFGEPRGEKIRFSGEREITVVGIGTLHFRVDDGAGSCRVGFSRKAAKGLKWEWEY